MFGKNKRPDIQVKGSEEIINRLKNDPLLFMKMMFGKPSRPDMVIFDDVEERPHKCESQGPNTIRHIVNDRIEEYCEDIEDDVEMLEDRLDAMQRFLKLEYVKEEVTDVDGFTSVNKFMRKVKK